MYSNISFGNYYPNDSALHRMNPIVKLLNFIITIVLLILSMNLYTNVFLFALVIILMLLSFVPFMFYFNAFYTFRYIYILIFVICFLLGVSLQNSIIYVVKSIIVIEYLFILVYTTTENEINSSIRKLLFPLRLLFINTRVLSIWLTNIIKFFPMYTEINRKILKSAESRGIKNDSIIGRFISNTKLFKNKIRLTINQIKESRRYAKSKLFSYKKKRINYRRYKLGFYDIIITLFHVGIIIMYLMERGYLNEIFSRINL